MLDRVSAAPVLVTAIRRGVYQDSVNLMVLSGQLEQVPGVRSAAVMMGTPANKDLFDQADLLGDDLRAANPNDLCIAVRAATDAAGASALEIVDTFLSRGGSRPNPASGARAPRTLASARRLLPDANLALISVPGPYAAREARRALADGLHVLLFSDNVPLAEEVALKRLAAERGLLLMGADCGTAIVGGVPLGFANQLPRGGVGLVGASGTGLQEVSCLLARWGVGVSHALGTGSHDLQAAIGGSTTSLAMATLLSDPATRVVVWVSKPGDPATTAAVLERSVEKAGTRPIVAVLLGLDDLADWQARFPSIHFEDTLEAAALCAARWAGERPNPSSDDVASVAERAARLRPEQRRLRGLFAGGTLAAEAARVVRERLGITDGASSSAGVLLDGDGHRIVDYGDDAYTLGRAHPMIDPRSRQQAIRAAVEQDRVGILLVDVILGYGAHPDPAGALAPAIEAAGRTARERGDELVTIVSVVGTDQDPQCYSAQVERLCAAGATVARSNAQAARYAAAAIGTSR
jgi:FdrA protein